MRAVGDARPDTQYAIASITKTFVAAALVELGVPLDEPYERWGTPAQLLSHTSGLQRELPGDAWKTLEFPNREQILDSLDQAEHVLPAGRFHYSNLGYFLLGELVRERAGRPFEEAIQSLLLEPLGLARTTWDPQEPYTRGENRGRAERPLDKGAARASGGLWSTAADLARWGLHLARLDRLHRIYAHAHWDEAWGLGVSARRLAWRVLWGHGGASVGFQSALYYDPDAGTGAAVLTNATQPAGVDRVAFALCPAAPRSREVEAAAPPDVDGVVGSWWSEGVEHVFRWTGRLETADAAFERVGPDEFRSVRGREEGERLRVVRNDNNEPVELWWAGYPFRRERGYSY